MKNDNVISNIIYTYHSYTAASDFTESWPNCANEKATMFQVILWAVIRRYRVRDQGLENCNSLVPNVMKNQDQKWSILKSGCEWVIHLSPIMFMISNENGFICIKDTMCKPIDLILHTHSSQINKFDSEAFVKEE